MAQGGLHRGVAVCRSNPGPPVTQPSPRLVCVPLPQPTAPHVLHRYIMGWISFLSDARRGLRHNHDGLRPGD